MRSLCCCRCVGRKLGDNDVSRDFPGPPFHLNITGLAIALSSSTILRLVFWSNNEPCPQVKVDCAATRPFVIRLLAYHDMVEG